mgnify:FL=1
MKKNIIVNGMSCQKCVAHVKEALEELKDVNVLDVNLETKIAVIESNQEINDEDIKSIIDEYGYEVESIETI